MCSDKSCIGSKEGQITKAKEKLLERWSEYIQELYDDNMPNQMLISKATQTH